MFEKEKEGLRKVSPLKIIHDIQSCFQSIINYKNDTERSETSVNSFNSSRILSTKKAKAYEEIIQKFEAEIRSHIGVTFK